MRTLAAVVVACGMAAGIANAQPIEVMLEGDLALMFGSDTAGIDGDRFTMTATFDGSGTWGEAFGLPRAVSMTSGLSIGGSAVGFNETLAFYPTFAGAFSDPDGQHLTFTVGASSMTFFGNMVPAPGAADAIIGGAIELDDFEGAQYVGANGVTGVFDNLTGAEYTLNNVTFTVVPAPAAAAVIGFGGLLAARRRR